MTTHGVEQFMKGFFSLILLSVTSLCHAANAQFVDNQLCVQCHQTQAKKWRQSDHYHSMLPANKNTVLGNFNNARYSNSKQKLRFFIKDNRYYVAESLDNNTPTVYRVRYTFGYRPLQQYLLEFPDGKLQVLNVAWDTIKKKWFNVVDEQDVSPLSMLHWKKRFYNWNYACAECHSTNFRKNPSIDGYQSQFSGVNVNCQACHGPGSAHIQWTQDKSIANKGLVLNFKQMKSEKLVAECAHCHARRSQVSPEHDYQKSFDEMYIPALLRPQLYYADGQIKDEVFVYGSFIQSKMYQAGVQCLDCHDPHSLKLRLPKNQLCTQCHNNAAIKRYPQLKSKDYTDQAHTHHQPGAPGSFCVDCHMPQTRYMKVDLRRDHSFKVPNPLLTVKWGIPNACNRCHQDKTANWALTKLKSWFGRSYQNSPVLKGSEHDLLNIYTDQAQPDIFRASALMLMKINQASSAKALVAGLNDASTMVRMAAIDKLSQFPTGQVKPYLETKLKDKNPIIRALAAKNLATSSTGTNLINDGLKHYIAMQRANIDQPESHVNLAQLYFKKGQQKEAIQSLQQAIALDEHFIPAYLMLAQVYSLSNKPRLAIAQLKQAIAANNDVAQLYFYLALAYGEIEDFNQAKLNLQKTLTLDPNYPRARRNLAIIETKLKQQRQP